jgi:hypothetical protein
MILDDLLQVSDAQAVSAAAYSTDTVDLGATTPARRIGAGAGLSAIIVVTVAAAGDSASMTDTFDFLVVQSANANLSSHSTIIQRRIPGAQLTVGSVWEIPIPADRPTARYLGVRYEPGTGDTVTVDAYFVPRDHVQAFIAYAKGYAV